MEQDSAFISTIAAQPFVFRSLVSRRYARAAAQFLPALSAYAASFACFTTGPGLAAAGASTFTGSGVAAGTFS